MKQLKSNKFLTASNTPISDIAIVTYDGQDPKKRQYRFGWELFFNQLPILSDYDPFLDVKINTSQNIMKKLAERLVETVWIKNAAAPANEFERTIIAIEPPEVTPDSTGKKMMVKEGKEIIVAHWGDGFSSPVHGHADGFLHEELLNGKMRVNTYRIISAGNHTVRLIRTDIFSGATTIASSYASSLNNPTGDRTALVHNFTSVGASNSLHYVPEHTRDGRDNKYTVEYFAGLEREDVKQIDSKAGLYLRKGEVVLVRSTNVPEYGDHFIVITGHPVVKEHGLRPQDVALEAPNMGEFLDSFELKGGLTLLQLNPAKRDQFLRFHGIEIDNGEVVFPQA